MGVHAVSRSGLRRGAIRMSLRGVEDPDRALRGVEDFIKLVKGPKVSGYIKRAEAENILNDLDDFRRRYLGVVGEPAELFYRGEGNLILRVCQGSAEVTWHAQQA